MIITQAKTMSQSTTKLCQTCSVLEDLEALATSHSETLFTFEDNYPNLDQLTLSADSGCGFCQLLRSTLLAKSGSGSGKEHRVQISASTYIISAHWAGIGGYGGEIDGNSPTGATHEKGISKDHLFLAGLKVRVIDKEDGEAEREMLRCDFLLGFDDHEISELKSGNEERTQSKGFFEIKKIQGLYQFA